MRPATAIYLDNAATSYPKPGCVYDAVDQYQRHNGRPFGRGATDAAQHVQAIVDRCRFRAAQLLGATAKEQIIFTFNGTDGLNLVLHGLLKPGDHVVSSIAEHNSVLRPLRHLERKLGVSVTLVDCDSHGFVAAHDIAAALRPNTRLIALQHASNVTGAIQPIDEVGAIARQHQVLFLVDAAQTAGHVPFKLTDSQPDFLACSGHKGLLGPLGTGFVYIAPGREALLEPLRQGGTGSRSELDTQPDLMPDRFESGNHNVPGLVGLEAALEFLTQRTIESIRRHELELSRHFVEQLSSIDGITLHRSPDHERHTGVVSVTSSLYSSDELALLLSQQFGIDTRTGLHCAPGIHRRLGTLGQQGTVRFSLGWHNTPGDINAACEALRQTHGF